MKLINCLGVAAALSALSAPVWASPSAQLLGGDVRLACEAVLCLSSGDRPTECAPALKRYFSIRFKKLGDTVKARKNFLQLCPAGSAQGMPKLLDALAHGAGRCDAAELNRVMRRTRYKRVCTPVYSRFSREEQPCTVVRESYISRGRPQYCAAYFDHGWTTAGDRVRYVGDEKSGGRWVDVR